MLFLWRQYVAAPSSNAGTEWAVLISPAQGCAIREGLMKVFQRRRRGHNGV